MIVWIFLFKVVCTQTFLKDVNDDLEECLRSGLCFVTENSTSSATTVNINGNEVDVYTLAGSNPSNAELFELEMKENFVFTISKPYIFRDLHVLSYIFFFFLLFSIF
jgi:hypothetical protein